MGMAEAHEELKARRRKLFELRLQLTRGEVKDNRQFAQTKKDIARLMFHIGELNRQEWAEDEAQDGAVEAAPAPGATAEAEATEDAESAEDAAPEESDQA
jgi:large subunit ribosomal protein L29